MLKVQARSAINVLLLLGLFCSAGNITYYYRITRGKMILVVPRSDQNWSDSWLIILMITERARERERERSDELGVKLSMAGLSIACHSPGHRTEQCWPQSFGLFFSFFTIIGFS